MDLSVVSGPPLSAEPGLGALTLPGFLREVTAAVFGVSLAGGVAVALSTFSTPDELGHLLAVAGVSVLLFERT